MAEVFFKDLPLRVADVDVAVDFGDALFDLGNEDGFELTFVAVALAVRADEVRVEFAGSGFGIVDDESAAALAAAYGGFEMVIVNALPFAAAVLAEGGLDLVPGGFVD